jgi:hypothetical protein
MNSYFSKAFAVALGGFLASCASTPHSASSAPLQGKPQLASAQQVPNASDAALRAGVPAPQASGGVCALIPEAEQNVCPLQRTPVLAARQLVKPLDPKGYSWTPAGAVVYMVAGPGLTPEWLGHLVECYQARTAAEGNTLQARESCPLAEPESSYTVSSTRDGFAVSIRAPNSESAKRVFDASQRLAPSNSPQIAALAVRP